MSRILDGRRVRDGIKAKLAARMEKLKIAPSLAIIQVGENPASTAYVKQKIKFGGEIGAAVKLHKLSATVSAAQVLVLVKKLNRDQKVTGLIVQLPLPAGLDSQKITAAIASEKDVDGLTLGSPFTPATARGVLTLLDFYNIGVAGKHAVVIGRSQLVGRPIAQALLARDATVTVCHSQTKNLATITKTADLIVVATGKPKLITVKHVRPGQIIIDVGITRTEKGLTGDVDFKNISRIVRAISPVPGGVGPLTVASLFENLVRKNQP